MGRRGFTLIEIVIVLAVIAVIAAFLVPAISSHSEKSSIVRATSDCKTIGEAILSFYHDTRAFPVYSNVPLNTANDTLDVLYSDGIDAVASGGAGTSTWLSGNRDALRNHLEKGQTSGGQAYPTSQPFPWKGPYLTNFPPDPWGARYYVNSTYLQAGAASNAVWVISAGPNKLIETDFGQPATGATSPSLGGDDIGYRVK